MSNVKKEEFKAFVRANPFLIDIINNSKKSWQDLFEFYDLYGSDEGAWNKLLEGINNNKDSKNSGSLNNRLDEVIKMAKNVDVDKVQEGITSLQKA